MHFSDGDEEITSSEDEDDTADVPLSCDVATLPGKKRKAADIPSLDACEQLLAKRHCAMKPYRDSVVAL